MPGVRGSNPVIGKLYIGHLFVYCQLYRKDENKEKEAGNGPFKKEKNYHKSFGPPLPHKRLLWLSPMPMDPHLSLQQCLQHRLVQSFDHIRRNQAQGKVEAYIAQVV